MNVRRCPYCSSIVPLTIPKPLLPIREQVPWHVVRDRDELRWTVSIRVPLARCEAVISVLAPATRIGSEAMR
jgi:hypothetical protein